MVHINSPLNREHSFILYFEIQTLFQTLISIQDQISDQIIYPWISHCLLRGLGDNSLLLYLLLGLELGLKFGLQFLGDNDWVAKCLVLGLYLHLKFGLNLGNKDLIPYCCPSFNIRQFFQFQTF